MLQSKPPEFVAEEPIFDIPRNEGAETGRGAGGGEMFAENFSEGLLRLEAKLGQAPRSRDGLPVLRLEKIVVGPSLL